MTTALIDGDIVAYRAAAAAQKDIDWGDGETGATVNVRQAVEASLQTTAAWMSLAHCKDTIVTFTGRDNWRKVILPTYKHNRAGKVKPQAYRAVCEAMNERFPCRMVEGLEADDLMGILATSEGHEKDIVVTLDKDLRTVPGRHFNPLKDTKPYVVSELEGGYRWLLQALMGDPVDGYTGIPNVGPARAAKILGAMLPVDVLWPKVVAAYRKAGLTEDDALTMARVARILQRCDYDKTTKEIILWHPTSPLRLLLAAASAPAIPSTAPLAASNRPSRATLAAPNRPSRTTRIAASSAPTKTTIISPRSTRKPPRTATFIRRSGKSPRAPTTCSGLITTPASSSSR